MELPPPNPYQPPVASIERPAPPHLAGDDAPRGSRLAASLIDGVLSLIVIWPLQYGAGIFDDLSRLEEDSFSYYAIWSLIIALVWIATHGVFLAKSAQTVGKKLMGIQVVNIEDGRPAPLERLVVLRFLPIVLVGMIPGIGMIADVGDLLTLVDVLFIFRSDRRCIHDHIARTRVIVLPRRGALTRRSAHSGQRGHARAPHQGQFTKGNPADPRPPLAHRRCRGGERREKGARNVALLEQGRG